MRLAFLSNTWGALSETFTVREVRALQARGHECRLFGGSTGAPAALSLPCELEPWDDRELKDYAPEVLYGTLGLLAHRRTFEIAQATNTPFALRVWQGYDSFAQPHPEFYADASAHRLCLGVIVEDEW